MEGASGGKGRGRQVIATARTSDLILVMLDSSKADIQKCVEIVVFPTPSIRALTPIIREFLEREMDAMGIRLNKKPPNLTYKVALFRSQCKSLTTYVAQANRRNIIQRDLQADHAQ